MKTKLYAATAAVLLSALTACTSTPSNTGPNGSTVGAVPGEDGCIPIVVATSSEKVNLMDELGQVFKTSPEAEALDSCATVYPTNVSSGRGAELFAKGGSTWPLGDKAYWPTVWSPASTVWTDRVAATGLTAYANAKSFTKTPVVLGVPETMANALGYPDKPFGFKAAEAIINDPEGWGSIGKPIWGSFKVAKTNPNTSTTGLSTILMQSYAASGKKKDLTVADVENSSEFSRSFESAAIHYGDTTGNVLKTLYAKATGTGGGSAYVSAVAIEETSLFNYNKGNPDSHTVQPGEVLTPPGEKLIAVYPVEGSMTSDNPAVLVSAPWVSPDQKAAGEAFIKFLQSRAAQEVLPKYGFRPLDKTVDVSEFLNGSVGIDPSMPKVELPKPSPSVVSAAIDQWAEVRKPSAVLELIDISGSMDEPIGDGRTRLQGAVQGAQNTLGNFRSTDEIGVWAFTTEENSRDLNKTVVREFAPLRNDLEKLETDVSDLLYAPKYGTPLYDAIADAYEYMVARAEPGRINALVVLSDGEDTDSRLGIDSLLVKLNSASEGNQVAPVRIFTIAYSEGADTETLARIAQATGGQSFDASDPERIDAVFASVINNF